MVYKLAIFILIKFSSNQLNQKTDDFLFILRLLAQSQVFDLANNSTFLQSSPFRSD